MKVLNLYAGIGGNRKLWEDVDVTAVEWDEQIAGIYQDFFPDDNVIVTDAHQYLLDHYDDGWDFIWSSPPCPTHSKIRNEAGIGTKQNRPVYPDMKLYEEIIFLWNVSKNIGCDFNGKYCVENVRSYYKPLIKPFILNFHYLWSNFLISKINGKTRGHMLNHEELSKLKLTDLSKYKLDRKDKVLRNCTEPEVGLHIFKCAFKVKQARLV